MGEVGDLVQTIVSMNGLPNKAKNVPEASLHMFPCFSLLRSHSEEHPN